MGIACHGIAWETDGVEQFRHPGLAIAAIIVDVDGGSYKIVDRLPWIERSVGILEYEREVSSGDAQFLWIQGSKVCP